MKQRNSQQRTFELAERAIVQRMRGGTSLRGFPASINRRTGKPHEHVRAKARRLRQIGAP